MNSRRLSCGMKCVVWFGSLGFFYKFVGKYGVDWDRRYVNK